MSKITLELEFDDVTLIQRALQTVSGHSSSAAGQLIQRIAEQEAEQVLQMDYVATVFCDQYSPTIYSVYHPMSVTKTVTATYEEGEWIPQNAYDNGRHIELPSCFSLSPGALVALEACRLG